MKFAWMRALAVAVPMLSASTLAAQTPIAESETVSGRLTADDPTLNDESHYQLFVYRGQPGERIEVTMRSTDFDAYLSGGRLNGGSFVQQDYDDDGAGGSDARMLATVGLDGTYVIRANSFAGGETGAFTLRVERVRTAPASPTAHAALRSVAIRQTVRDRITDADPQLPDGSHYHMYLFRGQPGERIEVTLRSSDFDAYLAGGRMAGETFSQEVSDDDSGGGTDARIVATAGVDGTYVIRVNTLRGGETGEYSLSVESAGNALDHRRWSRGEGGTIAAVVPGS